MTKPRRPGSFENAIVRIMGALTPEGAADAIGKSVSLLRRASDSDDDFRLCIDHCLSLDSAYVRGGHGPAPILGVYKHHVLMLGQPAHSPADPADRLVDVMRELGELAGEVRIAGADRHWSPGERGRVLAAIGELREEVGKLERDVETVEGVGGLRVAR
jgi:hypothetical protein